MKSIRKQAGDTILEVLISVAVLSLILGVSFTLANRSSLANQQAAERVEAYNYAQAHMELLKDYIATTSNALPAPGQKFCFTYNPLYANQVTGTQPVTGVANIEINYNGAQNSCKRGTGNRYVTIMERGSGVNANLYTVHVRWDSITGNGTDRIDMIHKIYPSSASIGVYLS